MPFKLVFLSAPCALTKTITRKSDKSISKSAYPLVSLFTSESVQISDITQFYKMLIERAFSATKPCLLKGIIHEDFANKSRAHSTNTNDRTSWVCLDIDKAKFSSPEEVMHALNLKDISYIVQYSASHKLEGMKTLNCHIFFLLSEPINAPRLKKWLMHLNLSIPALETNITLSNSEASVHWPLDITGCQNDKLLYVAAPIFKGMPSPIKDEERIKLVIKAQPHLMIDKLAEMPLDVLKKKEREKLNSLRTAAGLTPLKTKTKQIGEYEVQTGAGAIAKYEVIDCGDYNRLNLNGGDSQAYWHRKGDLTYLHNFKGEPSLILKEVLPDYYADLVGKQKIANVTPSSNGDLVFCFQERVTATYWWGTWNPETRILDLNTVENETKLANAMGGYGLGVPSPVPIWSKVFNPHSDIRVDEDKRIVNMFEPTRYMLERNRFKKAPFPIIQRLIDSAVGVGPIQDHFINWLAVMWQFRKKPLTAWVLHGVQGTGKGQFFDRVIRPLFGVKNTTYSLATELKDQYNGTFENSLISLIDEIEVDMFNEAKSVDAKLKAFITEPTVKIRRMRTDWYEVPSYTGLLFYSNKPRPVHIDQTDRRFNVGQFQKNRFITTLEELKSIEGELEAFAAHLTAYKAEPNRAAQVLQTKDRIEVQKISINSTQEIADAFLKGDIEYLWEYVSHGQGSVLLDPVQSDYNQVVIRLTRYVLERTETPVLRLSREDMRTIYSLSIRDTPHGNKFTSMLRHCGIVMRRIRIGGILEYGIEVPIKITPELRKSLTENLAQTSKPFLRGVK